MTEAEGMFYAHAVVFLDARSPELYDEGHIQGALNLSWEDFDTRFAETLRDFPVETTFVTYCDGEGCGLSRELAMAMLERGYNEVRVLMNEWTLWQNKRLPAKEGTYSGFIKLNTDLRGRSAIPIRVTGNIENQIVVKPTSIALGKLPSQKPGGGRLWSRAPCGSRVCGGMELHCVMAIHNVSW